jgi:ABC-2 family transporter protein
MTRSFLSEWIKLRRPGMILGGAGTIVGFAILAVVLSLTTASSTPTDQEGPGGGVTLAHLATADGLASVLGGAATVIGVVALSVFAMSIASEYSQGTLRNLLVRQPRRVRLLAGKMVALASFTTLAVVVAGIAAVATALVIAPTQDISTSAWFTSAGWTALAGGLSNLLLATLGWALSVRCSAWSCAPPQLWSGSGWPGRSRVSCWSPPPGPTVPAGYPASCWTPSPRAAPPRSPTAGPGCCWPSTGWWPWSPAPPCSPAATSPPDPRWGRAHPDSAPPLDWIQVDQRADLADHHLRPAASTKGRHRCS